MSNTVQYVVEVFKTNVTDKVVAKQVTVLLQQHFSDCIISFDLEDCDKVLRMEGQEIEADKVLQLLHEAGYKGTILE